MRSKEIDMTHGPLLGKLIIFAIPVLLSGVLQLLFNAADMVVVGNWAGDESLAAVGSCSSLINLLLGLFMGLSVGANVVVAQFYGAGHKESVSATVHTSIMVAVVSGVGVGFVSILMSRIILGWMGSPAEVIGLATLYLRIYCIGMPASLTYNFGASILRAVGNTKTPLYFLTIAGVINVLLNLFLVIVVGIGVAGVAIATVTSQYVSAAMIIIYLHRREDELKFSFSKLAVDKKILKKIIKIGVPSGIQGMVFSFSNVVLQSAINSLGQVAMAANSAAMSLEGFVYIAMNSVHQTAITFSGQNFGAGEYKRIKKVTFECMGLVFVIGFVLGRLMYYFSIPLIGIYSNSAEVAIAGSERLYYVCLTYFLCGMMDTMVGVMRGMGKSFVPMVCSILGACVFRLIWIGTFFKAYGEPWTLYIVYPISWGLTLTAHIICFSIMYRKLIKGVNKTL